VSRPRRALSALAALTLAGLAGAAGARADVSLTSLIEAQAGDQPFLEPANRTDVYGQVGLEYRSGPVLAGGRFEFDDNSEGAFTYRAITQRYAEWQDPWLRVRVGNLYGLLGRGLLFRAFEVPGVILDDPVVRARYGFSRDLDGVLAASGAGPLELLALAGRPNAGVASPAAEDLGFERYAGRLAGGQAALALPGNVRLGAGYVRFTGDGARQQESGSGFLELDPLALAGVRGAALPLAVEYAESDATFAEWWRFRSSDRAPHALYASANLLWGRLGVAAEWKDYAGFRLGYNDPPSLVKEHTWPLLNRNTHLLNAEDERGHQVEGSWAQPPWGSAEVNHSRSDGFFAPRRVRFEETYALLHLHDPGRPWEASVFVDRGQDGFQFVADREAAGGEATARLGGLWSASVELGIQRTARVPDTRFRDLRASLGVARGGWGSASITWERTTDPEEEDPGDLPVPGVQPRSFVAGIVQARLSEVHQLTLFVGTRRGGRACTAGTCYEVEPFEGVELRLTSRLTP
jgi:hypothetical protein